MPMKDKTPMKKRIKYTCVIVLTVVASCDIFGPGSSQIDPKYPTSYPVLSLTILDSLNVLLTDINPPQYCGVLDSFGFTGEEICHRYNTGNPIQKSTALRIARDALLRNQQFTNVTDTTQLAIFSTSSLFDDSEWTIEYTPQHYQDKRVLDTRLAVTVNSEGVLNIYNHWYPEIYLPESANFDSTDAKNIVIGNTLTYAGYSGAPNKFKITRASLTGHKTVQSIVPYPTPDGLEMRLTWRVPVSMNNGFPDWFIYVDVMTGEPVRTQQLFRT